MVKVAPLRIKPPAKHSRRSPPNRPPRPLKPTAKPWAWPPFPAPAPLETAAQAGKMCDT
jgi:hypothetical protein